MAAKKSNPDAKRGSVTPVGHAVNFTGKASNTETKVTRLHEAVNSGGVKGKGMKAIDGTHDVKTDVLIPSVKDMSHRVNKQFADNDKINKKRRGETK